MIFLGGGSLLSRAVHHTQAAGLEVKLVCCPCADPALPRLKRTDVPILETNDPNRDLPKHINGREGIKVFSINNKFVLDDHLLGLKADFFNMHNGLTQRYRGIAEVCVFAAICCGEEQYGATLHRLLPMQRIDAGPIVAQRAFEIEKSDSFHVVMKRSLDVCEAIFANNINRIAADDYSMIPADSLGNIYSYNDVSKLCREARAENLARASDLGGYRALFPKLNDLAARYRHDAVASSSGGG